MRHPTNPCSKRRRGHARERGLALVLVLFTTAVLGLVAGSTTLSSYANVRASGNYKDAMQARYAAEAGLTRALRTLKNSNAVYTWPTNVTSGWANFMGSTTYEMPNVDGHEYGASYQVAAFNMPGNPAMSGRLRATATGHDGARSVVVANMTLTAGVLATPGAIYLVNDAQTDSEFTGNAFFLNGNDKNVDGTSGPNPPVPGLATRNASNTAEAIASLQNQQLDNVQGLGYSASPLLPSVMTSYSGPTMSQVDALIAALLAQPSVVANNDSQINGNVTLGTQATPQITHFTHSSVTFKANGNASGVGIMIFEGDVKIQGNFQFSGLILVRGRTQVDIPTELTGNATIYGSLWTTDVDMAVGGSAIAQYSSQGLSWANNLFPPNSFPADIKVSSVIDCMQMPTATGGCP